jgi:hypothetical protein
VRPSSLCPELPQKLIERVHAEAGSRSIDTLAEERDEVLLRLLNCMPGPRWPGRPDDDRPLSLIEPPSSARVCRHDRTVRTGREVPVPLRQWGVPPIRGIAREPGSYDIEKMPTDAGIAVIRATEHISCLQED